MSASPGHVGCHPLLALERSQPQQGIQRKDHGVNVARNGGEWRRWYLRYTTFGHRGKLRHKAVGVEHAMLQAVVTDPPVSTLARNGAIVRSRIHWWIPTEPSLFF